MPNTPRHPDRAGRDDPKVPYEAESDIGETTAWCEVCGDERRFVRETRTRDAEVEETEADVPDVQRAMEGDTGWRCTVCGSFFPRLVSEDGYEYEWSDVGYTKPQFRDEETTIREAASEGVTPPARAEAPRRSKDG